MNLNMAIFEFHPCNTKGGGSYRRNGFENAKSTMDLIIVDVPKGLPIPTISDPADVVPPWN